MTAVALWTHAGTDASTGIVARMPENVIGYGATWAPSRFDEIARHAEAARQWLREPPSNIAERIAFRNADVLLVP